MLDGLDKGDKRDLHLALYEAEVELLDALCKAHNCSRAAVVGALLHEYAGTDLTGRVPEAVVPGKISRRR